MFRPCKSADNPGLAAIAIGIFYAHTNPSQGLVEKEP